MLNNYFKIAFRNLFRNKFYSLINILGLSTGIAVSLLISLYVFDELSYDKFHIDSDRIYQIYEKAMLQGKPIEGANTCAPIAAASKEELVGVDDATRINLWRDVVFRNEDKIYTEEKLLLADSNFFSFFSFELLEGNPDAILNQPNQIVLTENSAKKYFGYEIGMGESPLGKSLVMGNDKTNCAVVGIVKNPPKNSHFQFDMVLSMITWDWSKRTDWTSNSLYSYVKLNEKANPAIVSAAMLAMSDRHVSPEIEMYLGITLKEWRENGGGEYAYYMQPMTDIHLYSQVETNIEPPGNIAYVYLLSVISIFIILIACINFMNLSTARATGRAKEVGIRKTVGAARIRLVGQFLLESIIISTVSSALALAGLFLALPFFNQMADKSIEFANIFSAEFVLAIILVILLVGVLAGSYPAFYLTSFKPVEVLKGKIRQAAKGGWIRSSLVVFQFAISVSLIVCTIVIFKQLKLVQEKDLGFDKENILIIDNARTLGENKQAFKNRLKGLTSVIDVSNATDVPPDVYSNSVHFPNGIQEGGDLLFQIYADQNYLNTLGLSMYQGRYFSKGFPSDTSAVVINKKAMEALGWTTFEGNVLSKPAENGGLENFEVIGIMNDFNFSSLKSDIDPLVIFLYDDGNLMPVRLGVGDIEGKIKEIEGVWNEMAPDEPFDYSFLDENFEALFRAEQRFGKIFVLFTSLAIFIACLGLFGLSTFIAEQRSKEIGIRKSLGASVPSVVMLLSKEFTKLVFISIIIAVPAVIILMNWWLENFAYKTEIGILSFVIGGVLALVISWLTVSYQSISAALSNPVDALKYE